MSSIIAELLAQTKMTAKPADLLAPEAFTEKLIRALDRKLSDDEVYRADDCSIAWKALSQPAKDYYNEVCEALIVDRKFNVLDFESEVKDALLKPVKQNSMSYHNCFRRTSLDFVIRFIVKHNFNILSSAEICKAAQAEGLKLSIGGADSNVRTALKAMHSFYLCDYFDKSVDMQSIIERLKTMPTD